MIYTTLTPEVESIITRMCQRWGCAAEHTLHCYENNITNVSLNATPIILYNEEDDTGLLAAYEPENKEYRVHTEILAPLDDRAYVLEQFLDYVYRINPETTKVWVETETLTRRRIMGLTGYKIHQINYTLIWPVFDLTQWTGDKMEGKEWKDMRYYWNKFHRDHQVQFNPAIDEDIKQKCKALLIKWKRERKTRDIAYTTYYDNAINDGFKGYDIVRIMIVDGRVAAFTAGFQVRPGYYYSSIGIYDPSIDRCNEIANMDDLINLKRLGYTIIDFGGVEKEHLDFKKKFRPSRYYKTHTYSITKW